MEREIWAHIWQWIAYIAWDYVGEVHVVGKVVYFEFLCIYIFIKELSHFLCTS